MATFYILDGILPAHRMELDDGRIRMVRMHGWLSVDIHEIYNDFIGSTPEQDVSQLAPLLGRPVRRILCGDRMAPWCGLPSCYILPTDVPNITNGDYLFVGYVYRDRGTRDPRRFTSTRFFVCWRPGQPPPHHLEDVCQLRLLLGAAEAPLPEDPVDGVPSLERVDVASL
jgi:hypothetical protein